MKALIQRLLSKNDGHLPATVFMNGIHCELNLAIFSHAALLTFPFEVRNHPAANIPLYGLYHKLVHSLAFFGGKGLHLREQFSGQRYVRVASHGCYIIARLTVILPAVQFCQLLDFSSLGTLYGLRKGSVLLSAKDFSVGPDMLNKVWRLKPLRAAVYLQ
jgi:hypothetical protein